MTRCASIVLVAIAVLARFTETPPASAAILIPEPVAAQHGLTRAWAAQVQLDSARGQLRNLVLDTGTLFAQTDQGILEAIDAETGKRLWTAQVGDRGNPTFAPAVNSTLVALINGSTVYLLNRDNGMLLWKAQLSGAPSAGPALSLRRVYVPMNDGMIFSYALQPMEDSSKELGKLAEERSLTPEQVAARKAADRESLRLKQDKTPPLGCRGPGRPLVAPLVTRQNVDEECVAWTTERGYLCVGRVDRTRGNQFALLYRLHTDAPISNQPCYMPPNPGIVGDSGVIFAASEDGYVRAVRERDGNEVWRFSTGSPIVEDPVALGRFVLVTNQLGGMYCLDATNMGNQVWWSPEVTRVVAASKQRVYAADKVGRIRVLDGRNGAVLDTIAAEYLPVKLANSETDRMFLASKTGLVQCLHEIELSQPLVRRLPPKEEDTAASRDTTKVASAEEPASDQTPEAKKPSSSTPSTPRVSGPKTGGKSTGKTGSTRKTGRNAANPYPGPGTPAETKTGRRGSRGQKAGAGLPPGGFPAPGGAANQGAGRGG
jgi:hypothetical protein